MQNIDYVIVGKEKYFPSEGSIESIMYKDSDGFRVKLDEKNHKFTFAIRLKQKAVVQLIEMQAFLTSMVTFQLLGQEKKDTLTLTHIFREESKGTYIKVSRKEQVVKIKIELSNFYSNSSGVVGLRYLAVKGERKIKKERIIKPVTFIDLQEEYLPNTQWLNDVKMRKMKETGIFSKRMRNKQSSPHKKKGQDVEQEQLQMAIELSKQEAAKNSLLKRQGKQTQIENKKLQNNPEYNYIDYDKYKDVFKNVNAEWVEAQKNMENQRGIRQDQRLSNMIVVRVFLDKKICLDIADKAKKAQLQRSCIEMGARVIDNPENNCLLIANRVDTEKVAKALKLKGVKVLRSLFLEECRRCQTYLEERDYFFEN